MQACNEEEDAWAQIALDPDFSIKERIEAEKIVIRLREFSMRYMIGGVKKPKSLRSNGQIVDITPV